MAYFTLPLVLQPAKSIISQNDVSRFTSCINYQTSVNEVLLLLSGEKKRDKQQVNNKKIIIMVNSYCSFCFDRR